MKFTIAAVIASLVLIACADGDVHDLTVDEKRRADTQAAAYFDAERPVGVGTDGQLIKARGSFMACRPQDSNANGLVTCTGVQAQVNGRYTERTVFCGYRANGVVGCNDKDQQ